MSLIHAVALLTALQDQTDPNRLPIGRQGTLRIEPGELADTRSGKAVTFDDFLNATDHCRFVYLGENHATAAHQAMEAQIIQALVNRGRQVIVGVEMYQRPKQDVLDQWSTGQLSEADFLTKSEWKTQWGFDYAFYRPVFETIRLNKLPLVALNVPHEWVHAVAKGGYDAIPMSAKLQLPADLFLGNREHRTVFDAMMGSHSTSGTTMDQMYAAQVLWDEGMADTAIKYIARTTVVPSTVFVVIAGSGHVMYEQGINYRITRRKGGAGTTLVMVQSSAPVEVSKGLGNFVYVTPNEPETKTK
jgi:uncharacterized iron-regulated protein